VFETNVEWLFSIALIVCRVRSVLDSWTRMFFDWTGVEDFLYLHPPDKNAV
jgi:hypothetical protein